MAGDAETSAKLAPDFTVFKAVAKNHLIHLLESLPDPKDLVLDDQLMRPLDRIVGASVLKEHGVSCIFKLENRQLTQGADYRLYLCRPTVDNVSMIAAQIQADQAINKDRVYRVVMVPRRSAACEKVLEREGIYGKISFDEFPLEFIALDNTVLSMEYPIFFKEYFVDNNFNFLGTIATSLATFEDLFGRFQTIHAFGKGSNAVFGVKQKYQEENKTSDSSRIPSEVSTLILIDRDVDYVGAFLSPLTYEGLLDEHFGIYSGTVDFEPSLTGQAKSVKWILNDQDEVFRDIRDKHFATVFTHLSHKAKEIQAVYNRKNDLKTVSDMRTFISQHLKGTSTQHRSLGLHISACEKIMKQKTVEGDFENQLRTEQNLVQGVDLKMCQQFIEEWIMRCFPVETAFRLLCLYSFAWGGIPGKILTQWKDLLFQSYGYQHMLSFYNLKRAGNSLLSEQDPGVNLSKVGIRKSRFAALAKSLRLLPDRKADCDIRNPKDISYLYNGAYIPMICRLVEQVLVVDKLPGFAESARSLNHFEYQQEVTNKSAHCNNNVMVFILGGCTYSEAAGLRMVGKLLNINLIVASTAFLTGAKLMGTVITDL